MKQLLNKTRTGLSRVTQRGVGWLLLVSTALARADDGGIIPISNNEKTASGTSFAQTIVTIFQKDLIPIVMISSVVLILWLAIVGMASGMKEAVERGKLDPLKDAIIKTVIIVVIGAAILYLLNLVRTFSFS